MNIGIVGGGLSGLYCAYKLCKNKDNNVYLYERNNILGGRIYTLSISEQFKNKNKNIYIKDNLSEREKKKLSQITYEVGAGRFTDTQLPLMNIFKELGIPKSDFIPIDCNFAYRTEMGVIEKDNARYMKLIKKIVRKARKCENLGNVSLFNFISYFLSDDDIQFLKYASCYSFEFFNMNMVDGLERLEFEFIDNPQFYILKGGLSRIITLLIKKLNAMDNCHIKTDCNLVSITEDAGKYLFNLNKKAFDKIIVTCDPNSLRLIKLFKPLIKYINPIKDHDLTRIYVAFKDTSDAREIFNMIGNRFTTNNILRYVIPIDKKNLLLMVYVEGEYGDLWEEKYKSGLIDISIEDQFYKLFKKKVEIIYRGYHFWKGGVHYTDKVINRDGLVKPFKGKEIYLANSSYSCLGWMSCSIEMSDKVIKKIDG